MTRRVDVPAARVERWVQGFAERHGTTTATASPGTLDLHGGDGAVASLRVPFPPWRPGPTPNAGPEDGPDAGIVAPVGDLATRLVAHLARPRRVAVLVVRRGGYAVAVVDGGQITASKVSRRHVQGRTAAGGWSQQRFARRREKQTGELADAAVASAVRVLVGPWPARRSWLVTGGDRPLVERALSEPVLRAVAELPRGTHLAVGDPDARWMRGLPELLITVSVTLADPGDGRMTP